MASKRAFGIFNAQNTSNINLVIGKNLTSAKGGDTRPASSSALKDLTNKTQRTVIHLDGEGKTPAAKKGKSNTSGPQEKELKSSMETLLRRIGIVEKAAPSPDANGYDKASLQGAEYAWGQMGCIREDLLDLDFPSVTIERKPLPPVTFEPLDDLPDFSPFPESRFSRHSPDELDPLDDVLRPFEVPELEFVF